MTNSDTRSRLRGGVYLRMLRLAVGVTKLNRIRNEYIRETGALGRTGVKLRWNDHVFRRDEG